MDQEQFTELLNEDLSTEYQSIRRIHFAGALSVRLT